MFFRYGLNIIDNNDMGSIRHSLQYGKFEMVDSVQK